MTKLIIGVLIGMGIAFTILTIWAKEEQKTIGEYEKWRRKS